MPENPNYTARRALNQWPAAMLLAAAMGIGGCAGVSLPLGGAAADGPTITGSTGTTVILPEPLPPTLLPVDALAFAEAVRATLASEEPAAPGWTNPASGSTGTMTALGAAREEGGETCRTFATTVTSIKGVHLYTCRACRTADGRVGIRSIVPGGVEVGQAAGI